MKSIGRDEVIDIVKKVATAESQNGFQIVGLFGSFAKSEDTTFSDLDIAYKIDHKLFSERYHDGFSKLLHIDAIRETLQNRLHKRVDLVSLNSSNEKLTQNILKDIIYV